VKRKIVLKERKFGTQINEKCNEIKSADENK
jgi:hypothetical protein